MKRRGGYTAVQQQEIEVIEEHDEKYDHADHSFDLLQEETIARLNGKFPRNALILATVLLIIGIVLLSSAVSTIFFAKFENENEKWEIGIPLLIVGFITFIPGVWAVSVIILAAIRVPGFYYKMIPQF